MDGYVQVLTSLDGCSHQDLSSADLDLVVNSLKRHILKVEAARLLLPLRNSSFRTVRLQRMLKLVFTSEKQEDKKIQTLRCLDCATLIVCGLCLTQKTLDTLKPELFETFIGQATVAAQQLYAVIVGNNDIDQAVQLSSADQTFKYGKENVLCANYMSH